MAERWASFDCYGTLIDWDRGIGDALAALWPGEDRDRLLARYHEVEPDVQRGSAVPYRHVMARTVREIARADGLPLEAGGETALPDSLPSWPPFPEVPAELAEVRDRGWRVAVLSNTDPDLLDASLRAIGVPVDERVTAAEAGSYKPGHGHWERLRERVELPKGRWIHVAASTFHDIAPASELGIPAVWVNRLGERSDLPRAAELPDLHGLADTLDGLVAPDPP